MATRAVPPLDATDQAIGSIPPRFGNVRRRAFLFAGLSMLALFIFLAMFETRARPTMDAAVQRLLERTRVSDAYRAPPYPQLDTGIDWTLGLALGAAGVVVGLFMGMLGMGGGVFKISCMLLVFEMDIFFARAV